MSIEIIDRLKRMETKIVRGFEELGIDTDVDPNWITVDNDSRVIYLANLGRSIAVIRKEAVKRGGMVFNKPYDLIHRGDVVGTLYL